MLGKSTGKHVGQNIVRRELLMIDGRDVELGVKLNPQARRLIVKVHPTNGEVLVIAPSKRALDRAVDFARSEADWIAKQLAQVPSRVLLSPGAHFPFRGKEYEIRRGEEGPVVVDDEHRIVRVSGRLEHAPRRIVDFLKKQAKREFEQKALEYGAKIGLKATRITVRDTASRWGSCSSTRSLSFSWRLILAPSFVLDYVVAHEVAHMKEMNHGDQFWRIVESLVGDSRKPQAWLRQHGAGLHRYRGK